MTGYTQTEPDEGNICRLCGEFGFGRSNVMVSWSWTNLTFSLWVGHEVTDCVEDQLELRQAPRQRELLQPGHQPPLPAELQFDARPPSG